MKLFKEFLNEAKQVGIIYHFTDLKSFEKILRQNFKLKDIYNHGYISFTRNARQKEFGKLGIKITIDGNKLSNKYKIQPFIDKDNDVTRRIHEENEERVIVKEGEFVDIKDSVLKIEHLFKLRLPIEKLEKIRLQLKDKYPNINYGQYDI